MNEQALGADHAGMIIPLFNHGESLQIAGRADAALASFTRCSALAKTTQGPDHFLHGACLSGEARELLALGRPGKARPLAKQAVAILDATGLEPALVATAHETLGNIFSATGDPAGARAELDKAIALFRTVGDPALQDLNRAERARARLDRR
jgi:tetratricopeptide (TPR) repeat protein